MKNKDLIHLLSLRNPESEVKILYEGVARDNPKILGYFEAFPYEVISSKNGIVIRVTKENSVGSTPTIPTKK